MNPSDQRVAVIDVGAYPHRHEISVEPLIERFNPWRLFAIDPYPAHPTGYRQIGGTNVTFIRKAAWIHDGTIDLAVVDGERAWDTTVMPAKSTRGEWAEGNVRTVGCFNLSRFIERWFWGEVCDVVLKLDCEGAEYPLLEHLLETGIAKRVDLLLVEWHAHRMTDPLLPSRQADIIRRWPGPIEEWG